MTGQQHPRGAGSTALGNAFIRGFHTAHEQAPVHLDEVAASLVSEYEWLSFSASVLASSAVPEDLAREAPVTAIRNWIRSGSVSGPHVLLRGRYTEDALRRSCAQGTVQYVLLGAGMDSFALRRPAWAKDVMVYELDQPATFELKRERVSRLRSEGIPGYAAVPVDLERHDLGTVLRQASGLDGSRHAFIAWSGVTYYLSRKAISAVLLALKDFFTGGLTLVLDYWDAAYMSGTIGDAAVASMFASVRRNGAEFRTGYTPDELCAQAISAGYRVTADTSAPELAKVCAALGAVRLKAHAIGRYAELEG